MSQNILVHNNGVITSERYCPGPVESRILQLTAQSTSCVGILAMGTGLGNMRKQWNG